MNNSDLPISRKIVANLAWRYRFAKRLYQREYNKEYSVQLRARAETAMYEARNAYIASKKILHGMEP